MKFDNTGICLHTGSLMTALAAMRSKSMLTLGLVLLTVILILPL